MIKKHTLMNLKKVIVLMKNVFVNGVLKEDLVMDEIATIVHKIIIPQTLDLSLVICVPLASIRIRKALNVLRMRSALRQNSKSFRIISTDLSACPC